MGRQETLHRSCKRIGEICRNVTRKEIIEIAIHNGWEIVPAGKEQLKACKKGHSGVPLPGHRDSAIIPNGTAHKVIKSLQQSAVNDVKYINANNIPHKVLNFYKAKTNQLEVQLAEVNSTNEKLKDDIEAAIDLAAETETRNIELSKEIYRQKCWIEGLKQDIANLIQQKVQQDKEMLMIAEEVEQQELRIKDIAEEVEQKELRIKTGAKKLTQFSRRLRPKLRLELQQIIQWLTEENP
ncbi:hypothetical protein Glo7428_2773 [Gloeocapsa sp. PCC 7428]|uniref:hypothetical protein n=1 Tax=Gloeocapsa sp. PCC 7428 TaxID=1173026 RepID=UPI0002A5F55D|nr:hypothetical protein [Gloeocapsa sp. PCC 7428]AFZ31274.1 hypothetical protein Glo7428_2773 [Gloeocapsa sp. PCC 7428]